MTLFSASSVLPLKSTEVTYFTFLFSFSFSQLKFYSFKHNLTALNYPFFKSCFLYPGGAFFFWLVEVLLLGLLIECRYIALSGWAS